MKFLWKYIKIYCGIRHWQQIYANDFWVWQSYSCFRRSSSVALLKNYRLLKIAIFGVNRLSYRGWIWTRLFETKNDKKKFKIFIFFLNKLLCSGCILYNMYIDTVRKNWDFNWKTRTLKLDKSVLYLFTQLNLKQLHVCYCKQPFSGRVFDKIFLYFIFKYLFLHCYSNNF